MIDPLQHKEVNDLIDNNIEYMKEMEDEERQLKELYAAQSEDARTEE
jgi:hypothetical protein